MGRRNRNIDLKGKIYIVGEGITEQYYFSHLKNLKSYHCTIKPRFFGNTSLYQIEKTVDKLLQGGVDVICVFDLDITRRNHEESIRLKKLINKYKANDHVTICDSLPSIEYWFLIHFKQTNKSFSNQRELEEELRKYLINFKKTKKYLQNPKWVQELNTYLVSAMNYAKSLKINNRLSYTNLYKSIEKLERTI